MVTTVVGAVGGGPGTTVVGVPTPTRWIFNGLSFDYTYNYTVTKGISMVIVHHSGVYPSDGDGNAIIEILHNGTVVASKAISSYFDNDEFHLYYIANVQEGDTVSVKGYRSGYSGSTPYGNWLLVKI